MLDWDTELPPRMVHRTAYSIEIAPPLGDNRYFVDQHDARWTVCDAHHVLAIAVAFSKTEKQAVRDCIKRNKVWCGSRNLC